MPNRIPQRIRSDTLLRADSKCEICGQYGVSPHHIIKRRSNIHRKETLIWLDTLKCHGEAERPDKSNLDIQLKLGLQELYLEYPDTSLQLVEDDFLRWKLEGMEKEDRVRELMGGRLYPGEVIRSDVKNHFVKIKELYF